MKCIFLSILGPNFEIPMLRFYALLMLLQASACMAADPSCETGIIEGDICCAKSCGTCGGVNCGSEKGGAGNCCSGHIEKSQKYCDENSPPCIIGPTPNPPTPATSNVTLTLGGSAIGTVDAKFVSITFDSSAWRGFDLSGSNTERSRGYGATLDVLVQGLHPAHLRVGGTQGDYDIFTGFSQKFPVGTACTTLKPPMTDYRCKEVTVTDFPVLLNFTARNNLSLVYGLSNMYGRPTKVRLLRMCTPVHRSGPGHLFPGAKTLWWGRARRHTPQPPVSPEAAGFLLTCAKLNDVIDSDKRTRAATLQRPQRLPATGSIQHCLTVFLADCNTTNRV